MAHLLISSMFVFVSHILKPVNHLNINIEELVNVNVNKLDPKYDKHAYI